MKKYQKILLITSACLIVGGGIMGVAGLALGGSPSFMITEQGIRTPEDIADGKFVEKTLPLKGVRSLEINWEEGDIEFVEGDSFHVEYGYDEKYIQVKEQTKNGIWSLTSKYIQRISMNGIHFFWNSSVWEQQSGYLRIYIPRGTKLSDLNVVSGYGKVKIDLPEMTAQRVKLNLESGNLDMKGLNSQEAELELEYGNLDMEDCGFEKLHVQNESGKCSLSGISAERGELNLDYGDLEMQNCDIATIFSVNENGKYSLTDVTAEGIKLESSCGEMVLEQITADDVTLKSESGNISVDGMTGKTLTVECDYGKTVLDRVTMETSIRAEIESELIRLEQVKTGQLDIVSESGGVTGSQVEIGTGNLELSYGDCEITEFTVKDLKASNESGEISLDLTGKEKDYSMLLETEYGEVYINGEDRGSNITLERDKAENRLELDSESGRITIRTR